MINISFSVDSVDYDSLIDILLPKLSEFVSSSSDPKVKMMASMPTSPVSAMLKALSEEKKGTLQIAPFAEQQKTCRTARRRGNAAGCACQNIECFGRLTYIFDISTVLSPARKRTERSTLIFVFASSFSPAYR